jgi:two-component system, OmpR family, catabolic regulation response regulator CreB
MSASLLLVEDDPAIAETLIYALQREGYAVLHCLTGRAAETAVSQQAFDLMILDVGLPDQTGFELCRALRRIRPNPVLFLTARNEEIDRIVGLELGAEDYVSKPFSPRELILRIKVILRRHSGDAAGLASDTSALQHDRVRAQIQFRQQPLNLTRSEYLLLATLLAQPERLFSREQLLEVLGPQSEDSTDRSIDTLIKQLRAKLRAIDASIDPITTHRGLGYSVKRLP